MDYVHFGVVNSPNARIRKKVLSVAIKIGVSAFSQPWSKIVNSGMLKNKNDFTPKKHMSQVSDLPHCLYFNLSRHPELIASHVTILEIPFVLIV